jgi:hypothetical protein
MGLSGRKHLEFRGNCKIWNFVMAVFLAKYCSADGGSFGIYGKKEALAGF